MLRALLGIALASVALFMWGYLFWGILPFADWTLRASPDDAAARAAIREHFPENGTYFLPTATEGEAALSDAHEEGPVAMIHMLRVEGRPVVDSSIMIAGFLLNLIVLALLAAMLAITARPKYWQRVQLCGVVGLAAVLLIDYGQVAWWEISRSWVLYNAAYHFSFFLLAGLILGAFVLPSKHTKVES